MHARNLPFGFPSSIQIAALLTLGVAGFSSRALAVAPQVGAGFDLEATEPGTQLNTIPLTGVPLGSFDFGGAIGVKSVSNADTIVQRLAAAPLVGPLPGSANPISIQLDALQLETIAPTNLGAGVGFYFVTLQSERGGPVSTGQTTINFDATGHAGTFSSFFDVFFDVRFGALNGPIVNSSDTVITNSGTAWQDTPPEANDVLINGVNQNLTGQSFWPNGLLTHAGAGETHVVSNAVTPEPAALSLVVGAGLLMRWRHRAK